VLNFSSFHYLVLFRPLPFPGSYFTQPPEKLQDSLLEKSKVSLELSQIKSIQLQFVKHSKLSRQMIALDKKIASYRDHQTKQLGRVKQAFLFGRVCAQTLLHLISVLDVRLQHPLPLVWLQTHRSLHGALLPNCFSSRLSQWLSLLSQRMDSFASLCSSSEIFSAKIGSVGSLLERSALLDHSSLYLSQ
jgi:hypothetical protein